MIRALRVFAVALVYTLRYGIPILFRSWRGSPALVQTCRHNPRAWARRILRAAGVEVVVEGGEHLAGDVPHVLVANHQSWFDVFALTAYLPGDYRFVAKKELEGIPVFGPAWQACGHISIDRRDLQKAIGSLEQAAEVMRRERPTLIMFPEGTRSVTGEVAPFKKGAFVLAIQVGAPIVPAAILGSREVMTKGDWRIHPGRVVVRIGAPIPVDDLRHDDREALSLTAHGAVVRLREGAPLEGPWEGGPSPRRSPGRSQRVMGGERAKGGGAEESD